MEVVSHGSGEASDVGEVGMVVGHGGDDGEAVQESLAGGCGAPAPVFAG